MVDFSAIHAARVRRYQLKAAVSRLYPASRAARCGVTPLGAASVQIWRSREHGTAFFSGLMFCSLLWMCPLCASKISERRRRDLQAAIDRWQAQGGGVYLLTATVPHGRGDDLRTILGQMLRAWRSLTKSRRGLELRAMYQVAGIVRAVEVTHGQNGWHPHIHALLFTELPMSSTWAIRDGYRSAWQHECQRAGLPRPDDAYGLRVDDGTYAAEYIANGGVDWGLSGELTKSHIKKGRSGSQSPWDLLRRYSETGDAQAERLFSVYVSAFRGCHQLHYSVGLKAKLGLSSASDSEVLASREDSAAFVFGVELPDWRNIASQQKIPDLLRMAETAPQHIDYYVELMRS